MKKFKWAAAAMGLTVILTACGETDSETSREPAAETSQEKPAAEESEPETKETEAEKAPATAEEILTKSTEAMSEVNSYRIDMKMDQAMQIDDESIDMDMEVTMDVMQDPMMFRQVMTMPNPESGEDMTVEQYMDEDGTIYLHEPSMGQWMSMNAGDMGITDIKDLEMSPEEQLEMLKSFSENIELAEEDTQYKLTINGSGEELKEIAATFAAMDMDPQMQAEMDQMMSGLDIKNLTYVMYIDKETYYQKEFEMQMDMAMEQDGQSLNMSQTSTGTFSKYDDIEKIEIPQEALDQSVDMQKQMEEMQNLELEENPA